MVPQEARGRYTRFGQTHSQREVYPKFDFVYIILFCYSYEVIVMEATIY